MASVWVKSSSAGELVELGPTDYLDEGELQRFIAEHPKVLAATLAGDGEADEWLLIQRELDIELEGDGERTRWRLDHLFIDADGMPTLVEVKRSSDPRSRREVVAQMLDYAASFRRDWSAEKLRDRWASTRVGGGADSADDDMQGFLDGAGLDDEDEFWTQVQTNIAGNRLRLLFVADGFAPQLIRIIEYLNEQMQTTEVVGIEVVPHAGGDEGTVAYVPTVRGRTSAVSRTKQPSRKRLTRAEWDALLRAHHGDSAVDGVMRLTDAATQLGGYTAIGTSPRYPRLFLKFRAAGTGRVYWPLHIQPHTGKVTITLRRLAALPAFAADDVRADVIRRFETAIGRPIDAPDLGRNVGFSVEALATPGATDQVVEVVRWITEVADAG